MLNVFIIIFYVMKIRLTRTHTCMGKNVTFNCMTSKTYNIAKCINFWGWKLG